ncbi:Uncharacterised protein [Metamycoplasma arthritidis]|uniref:Uncharacterized protein n=1 Tax=Metamycoplasma arthritidis (strain 158L3-1) TaxID=243272 RepID=B3PLX2_META1|nr:hypothetical protein [Metamycoplasma arthritidis]ACF07024.1 hypothetical protein MARTH_orf068 [Metamycoplasma arthritidis 158L3-1]VEU78552.1 Uncharacterised protein [Metamycoplasma arthritidis]
MKTIHILIITFSGILFLLFILAIILRNVFFKKTLFVTLDAVKKLEEQKLKIDVKFYSWVYKKTLIIYLPIAISWFLCLTPTIITMVISLDLRNPLFWIAVLLIIVFGFVTTFSFFKLLKIDQHVNSVETVKRSWKNNKSSFFENEVDDQAKYEEFTSKLTSSLSLDFIDHKNAVIKNYNFEKIKLYCMTKQNFSANNLNYLLFIDPEFVLLNNQKLDFKLLSYLRIYLFQKINNSAPFFS